MVVLITQDKLPVCTVRVERKSSKAFALFFFFQRRRFCLAARFARHFVPRPGRWAWARGSLAQQYGGRGVTSAVKWQKASLSMFGSSNKLITAYWTAGSSSESMAGDFTGELHAAQIYRRTIYWERQYQIYFAVHVCVAQVLTLRQLAVLV